MTISIISDLHCRNFKTPKSLDMSAMKPADVLVIAGDIAVSDSLLGTKDMIRNAVRNRFDDVVMLKGNHDYYVTGYYVPGNPPKGPSVEDNFVQKIGDVDFICTTLWSPIKNDETIRWSLNDYNYITDFTTKRCTELFWGNLDWLEYQYRTSQESGRRTVIVTHHLPRHELISSNYANSTINEAFCVIDETAEKRLNALKPELWIHGHSHEFLDMTIDGTRYVRNPYGYENSLRREVTGYTRDFIIEI